MAYCDFKVGDEVVCVDARERPGRIWTGDIPVEGATYVVRRVGISTLSGLPGVWLEGIYNHGVAVDLAYRAARFRKVQRRDLKAWLATENTIEGPVRGRKRVRA